MKNKKIIREKLLDILSNKYKRNIDKKENIWDLNLLGKAIRMEPSDLLCFFFDIEKQFNITISEEDIVKGKFKTVNAITEVIYKQCI
ncbi:peptide maturation system acyl carrier-related protein [Clostridium amazonitimonense]|uniref:peptide maturation system acyl carrier-related protein n=1 Tax=Clostridium amazonitimonense TaxID=1499689 RepID=UPI0005AA70D9|nr:peptide maturation system acyl carrier-related protein [Clostridium amazonitimonense]